MALTIALSGFAGNGKTTTLRVLSSFLRRDGYKVLTFPEIPPAVSDLFYPFFYVDYLPDKNVSTAGNCKAAYLFQFAITSIIEYRRRLLEQMELDDSHILLFDRHWLDNLIFAYLNGVIDETRLQSLIDYFSDYNYDFIYLIDKLPDDFVDVIMREPIRKSTIKDFRAMEEEFYTLYAKYGANYRKLPHPRINPMVPFLIYADIQDYLRRFS